MAETGDRSGLRYLVSATEIAKMFGASTPSTVSNWRARHADFPMPLTRGHNAQFDVDEILGWARRPDTPARLEKPPATWWWEKVVDAVRAVVDLAPRTGTGNPLRGHLAAVVLLHAALCGEMQGVRASAAGWKALAGSSRPADDLLAQARRLEEAHPSLQDLLVAPLGGISVPATALSEVFRRLEAATEGGASPRQLLEVVLERVSTAAHRKQAVTTTGDRLADVVARIARAAPGEVIYDPCVGEGGLLLTCARAAGGSVTAFAQELDMDASRIARTRFLLEPLTVVVGSAGFDALGEDQFPTLRADLVVADPPVAARGSLAGWVDHVVGHLTPQGRGVFVIPAYAVADLKESSRRQPDKQLIGRLESLCEAGQVASVAVLSSDFRRDVPGPVTVWSLECTPSPGRAIEVSTTRRPSPGDRHRPPPIAVSSEDLMGAIQAAALELHDTRGRLSVEVSSNLTAPDTDGIPGPVIEDVRRKLASISDELGALLDRLPPEEAVTVARVRRSVQDVETSLDEN